MARLVPIVLTAPPPLWAPVLENCRALMREVGAPAILVRGMLLETPFGPRIAATLDLPEAMGPVEIAGRAAYRRAMRDASGLVAYVRMAALGASGIGPIAAAAEPEPVSWDVVVLPRDVVLVARTAGADFGPFLLAPDAPDARRLASVGHQLAFAGVAVADPPGPS